MVAGQRPAVVPLSFAQQPVVVPNQLQGPSPIYNMPVALRLSGRLDAEALGAALADVVARQESLRTLFAGGRGIPQQVVIPAERADFGWQVMDANGWPAGRLQEAVGAGCVTLLIWPPRSRCGQRFSASADDEMCWWRCCTISPGTAGRSPHWWLIWGRPMPAGVLGRPRVGRRWRCSMWITRCGSARSWVIWPIAIAASLRSWLIGSRLWPGCLSGWGCPPIGRIRRVADYRGASVAVEWPAGLQQQVARVAREHNATGFMVVQAALAALLSELSASPEVAVGFAIAGRRDPALDELVGFFVNTLVLRVEVAGILTFAELLAQVRGRSLAAFEHQDVPFEVLVERLNPTRSPDPSPAGPGRVGLAELRRPDNASAAGLGVGDLQITPLAADTHTARMDLLVTLAERFNRGRRGRRDWPVGGVSHRCVRRSHYRGVDRAPGSGWWWR